MYGNTKDALLMLFNAKNKQAHLLQQKSDYYHILKSIGNIYKTNEYNLTAKYHENIDRSSILPHSVEHTGKEKF
jgi:hypothetical protein